MNEFSLFFKDDWKVAKSLTLNLGLRYDYLGDPYEKNGLMPSPIGGGSAAFGISRRSFNDWMTPGTRGEPTVFQYVGKNPPHPDIPWYPDDWNNFGPAVGFAWQVPWFGAGKTTLRGGYQLTYQIGDGFSSIVQETNAPGSSQDVSYTGDSSANAYLDLAKLPSLIPVPVPTKPLQPIPLYERSQGVFHSGPEPGHSIQNLTLSVTRSIGTKMSVDVRYIGALGRKQRSASNNINVPNFRSNGSFALPIGPGQFFLRNSSGVLRRVVEGWQMSWIVNMNRGQPLSVVAQNMLYNNGTADIVGPFDLRSGKVVFSSGPTGVYFSPADYKLVRDPQCAAIAATLQNSCTLNAVADVTTNQILLQHPKPGTRGTLGQRVVEGPGRWRELQAQLRLNF